MHENPEFDLHDFLPYLLNQASEASSLQFQRLYRDRYGMLRSEWRVLFHLGIYGPMTAREICDQARMHKTKISRAVQKLGERRFLNRTRSFTDKRVEHLNLTTAGRAAYRDLLAVAADYDRQLTAGLSDQEALLLRRMLRRLAGLP
ncbi:MAG: MarR family winged helix-turn-helix transcriptional regulator [Pseudomonadota bacterium]